jgi:CcmD family protein
MATFVTAYLLVWFGLLAYVARLGAKQRRLAEALESLQAQWEDRQKRAGTRSCGGA